MEGNGGAGLLAVEAYRALSAAELSALPATRLDLRSSRVRPASAPSQAQILWAECEHQGGADDRCDADDLATGPSVQLDASTDGQSYLAEVSRHLLSTVRARSGTKLTALSCLVLKSGSGVNCPP